MTRTSLPVCSGRKVALRESEGNPDEDFHESGGGRGAAARELPAPEVARGPANGRLSLRRQAGCSGCKSGEPNSNQGEKSVTSGSLGQRESWGGGTQLWGGLRLGTSGSRDRWSCPLLSTGSLHVAATRTAAGVPSGSPDTGQLGPCVSRARRGGSAGSWQPTLEAHDGVGEGFPPRKGRAG